VPPFKLGGEIPVSVPDPPAEPAEPAQALATEAGAGE
jgi:hypothetical protein